MFRKIQEAGPETQKKFLKGVEVVDKLVGDTLGPGGRNRLVQVKYKAPLVINDGATIARHIVLEDPIEDMAAQNIIALSMQTAEQAGDGTTTSVVMAAELVRSGHEALKDGVIIGSKDKKNPMSLFKEIQADKDKAISILNELADELTDSRLDEVISTSLENLEYGKTLGELFRKVGKDGYISVEENWATKKGIDTETVTGMRFLGKYASPYLVTTANKKEALWENAHILVTNQRLDSFDQLDPLVKEVMKSNNRKLVIFGGYSEGEAAFGKALIARVSAHMRAYYEMPIEQQVNVGQILLVQVPSLTTPELEDVACFCDAKLFDKNLNMKVKDAKIEDLGHALKVSVTDSDVNVIGGRGNSAERIQVLKDQAELEKDAMFKEKILRRIASLASGVGIIRVGASTDAERSYLKYKLEDAVLAVKAAWEEGIVPGGGLAYSQIADKLGEGSVLYSMLKAPHERIKQNLGVDSLDIPDTVIDPAKVVRIAIQNACSGAGMLLTSDGAIAEVKLTYMDYLEKAIGKAIPRDMRDDFRDSENQDQGAGRFID